MKTKMTTRMNEDEDYDEDDEDEDEHDQLGFHIWVCPIYLLNHIQTFGYLSFEN